MLHLKILPKVSISSDGIVRLLCPNAKFKPRRVIGRINYSKKLYKSAPKNTKQHLFRLDNSLSLPYDLIYKPNRGFIYVEIPFNFKKLYTSTLAIKKFATVRQYKGSGYEKQLFMNIDNFHSSLEQAMQERKKLKGVIH